jgi:phage replication-related protein YjqB (UPF0714/DUF867 family)
MRSAKKKLLFICSESFAEPTILEEVDATEEERNQFNLEKRVTAFCMRSAKNNLLFICSESFAEPTILEEVEAAEEERNRFNLEMMVKVVYLMRPKQ